jgi:hypothetical protein
MDGLTLSCLFKGNEFSFFFCLNIYEKNIKIIEKYIF